MLAMADSAGDWPSCLPPQVGVIEPSSSGLSAASPPPVPLTPPCAFDLEEERGRLELPGVSHAGNVTSATDPGRAEPGECVSARESWESVKWEAGRRSEMQGLGMRC